MSITETKKIDIVAARPNSAVVKLMIADHLGWEDFETHARLLQEKVNTYIEFVESGQLTRMETPKIPQNPEIHIVLVLDGAPSRDAERFFSQIREFLAGLDIQFGVDVRHAPH